MSASPDPNGSQSAGVLRLLLEDPLGLGYTKEAHDAPRTVWQRLAAALAVVVIVAVPLWAAKDLRSARMGGTAATALREQVARDLAAQDALESSIAELNAQVADLQAALLPSDNVSSAAALAMHVGTVPVTGPGLRITLDDSAALSSTERIQDYDLQILVNALWASGAEAIAIDGQRLSPSSAIRNAGEAVLVNLTPLSPPYVVEAIGASTDLQVRLARTRAAGHLAVLRDTYGITVTIDTADALVLNAAPSRGIRYAEILEEDRGSQTP